MKDIAKYFLHKISYIALICATVTTTPGVSSTVDEVVRTILLFFLRENFTSIKSINKRL